MQSSRIFLIADTHFGHQKIRSPEIEKLIIKNWKEVVASQDYIIHLGDFTFKSFDINTLPGVKVLVRGNHDKKSIGHYMNSWDFCCDSFEWNRILFTHRPRTINTKYHDYNIFGHCHTLLPKLIFKSKRHRLFSLEFEDYRPIELDAFLSKTTINYYKKRQKSL